MLLFFNLTRVAPAVVRDRGRERQPFGFAQDKQAAALQSGPESGPQARSTSCVRRRLDAGK